MNTLTLFVLASLSILSPAKESPIEYRVKQGEAWCLEPDSIYTEGRYSNDLVVCKWTCREGISLSVLFYWNTQMGWLVLTWYKRCLPDRKIKPLP